MFRKLISNLPFSPALVGQLGFYTKRLRKEKTTRRLGLIFVVLALIVQSLAVFQPPESVNASDPSNTYSEELANDNGSSQNSGIIRSITATNASQGFVDASSVTATASDQISYTMTIENNRSSSSLINIDESLSDILEYATLVDNGGGTLDKTTKVLSWSDATLEPNTKQTRTFVIRLLDSIPATAQGSTNNTASYNCLLTTSFGNIINIQVDCPALKAVERVASELPKAGPTENMLFAGIVLAIATYFYARTRQLEKEIRLIRRDASTGTI